MFKKVKGIIKSRSMASDILLSHILILLLSLIINIGVEILIIETVRDETEKSGYLVAENARNNFDNTIENIRLIMRQINSDEDMIPVYSYKKNDAGNYHLKKSMDVIKSLCNNADDVNDIFVYIPKQETVLTTMGIGDTTTFFDAYYKGCDIDYDGWVNSTENMTTSEAFRVVYKEDSQETAYIEYLAPLTGNTFQSYNIANMSFPAIIIVRINMDKLSLSKDISEKYTDLSLYAVMHDGRTVATTDVGKIDLEYIMTKCGNKKYSTFEKNVTMFMCCRSDVSEWIYVTSSPIWKFRKKTIIAIFAVMLCTLILCILGLKIINYFIKSRYGGLINVTDKLFGHMNTPESVKLDNIKEVFDTILDEREKHINEIDRKTIAINNAYILRLLEGMQIKEDDEAFISLKGSMASDKFMVLCCEIEDCDDLYSGSEYENISYAEKIKDTYVIVRNVLAELIENAGYKVNDVHFRNKLIFVVGNHGCLTDKFEKDIQKLCKNFAEYAKEKFSIVCVFAEGETVSKYSEIERSFRDAVENLPYKILLNDDVIVVAHQYRNRSDSYKITQNLRQQIIMNISAGNYSGVIDAIDELYRENFEKRKLSYEMIKCFLIELSDIFETAGEEGLTSSGVVAIEVLEKDRIYMTKRYFEALAEIMCEENAGNKTEKVEELVNKVVQYIDEYYADETINVYALANVVGLSRAYISRIFKSYTGYSMLDAIHKKRVDVARCLLKQGVSVNEVAHKVGYVNSTVFIRKFKQYTGETPRQYSSNF